MISAAESLASWRRQRRFDRELRSLIEQDRLQRLHRRLREAPVRVTATIDRNGGQRVTFGLDDESTLTLRLFWARHDPVRMLQAMRWHDDVGWIVNARTDFDEPITFSAWLATCRPGTDDSHRHRHRHRRPDRSSQ